MFQFFNGLTEIKVTDPQCPAKLFSAGKVCEAEVNSMRATLMPLGGSDQRLLEAASGDGLITTEKTGLGLATCDWGGGGSGDGRKGLQEGEWGAENTKEDRILKQNPQCLSETGTRPAGEGRPVTPPTPPTRPGHVNNTEPLTQITR